MDRTIFHIDMDAFYASVEVLDNPDLKGRCVIVGGQTGRGVVSAASYEARRFGVHSAMPIFQARKRCPDAVFLPPRMSRYRAVSALIMAILREFSPLVEPISIDEAFVDVTGCERLFGGIGEIALRIKERIREEVGLTCSLGGAPNKFLAKIASDMDKPDGLTVIAPETVDRFIESLPVEKVPGVGATTHEKLRLMGVKTLGDVRRYPEDALVRKFGKFGHRLADFARGIDRSPVTPDDETKSVSAEETLPADTDDGEIIKRYILGQAERVARELRKAGVGGRTVTLKIKDADFRQVTRSVTINEPTQSADIIIREALHLLGRYQMTKKIRLIGVGVSHLTTSTDPVQMDLFEQKARKTSQRRKLDEAIDEITDRFGKDAIKRATLKERE
ncbi:MAG: DNA polymerase IV [Deltaproteobacteria bacterium]|nr:DNA polymerase IV [Deltaproteobacteria bacterium]